MYHERTTEQLNRARAHRRLAVICAVILAIACIVGGMMVNRTLQEQGAASIRTAVLNSAKQCAAIEGAYPSSLAYLENEYGLAINHDDYVVTYEIYAANVMPSVVVTPR